MKYSDNILAESNKKTSKAKQKLAAKRIIYYLIATSIYNKAQVRQIKKQLRSIGAW